MIGLLALSWEEEQGRFVQFPGETWNGKTWLEQNRIVYKNSTVLEALLNAVPGSLHLRYLVDDPVLKNYEHWSEDEQRYVFYPRLFDYSLDNFWQSFSGKTRKKLNAELKKLEDQKITFRFDCLSDLQTMFKLNLDAFQKNSYFWDRRFLKAFENLATMLHKNNMLRITTVLIGGRVAAVDMGAIWKNTYTVLAGGTDPEFCGVAKRINLYHLEWSCRQRIEIVDFLCGAFQWKDRFHLDPLQLYQLELNFERGELLKSNLKKEVGCA